MNTQLTAKTLVPALLASMMLLTGIAAQAAQRTSEEAAAQVLIHDQVSRAPVSAAAYFDTHAAAERLLVGDTVAQRTNASDAAPVTADTPRYDAQATAVRMITGGTTAAPISEASHQVSRQDHQAAEQGDGRYLGTSLDN